MRWAALPMLLLCLVGGARAEEELAALLERWEDEPLDLRTVTAAELVLLPWLDEELAEAIVGLRELGGLHEMDDLLELPGLERERLEAIRPFVTLPRSIRRMEWSSAHRVEPGRPARARQTLEGESEGLRLRLRRAAGSTHEWGGWVSLGALLVGQIRPALGGGLWQTASSSRSRTASVSPSDRLDARGQLGGGVAAWTGLSALHEGRAGRLLTIVGRPGMQRSEAGLVAWQLRPAAERPAVGVGLCGDPRGPASWSLWCVGRGARPQWRVDWAGGGGTGRRASLAGRWRPLPWTLGLAATSAPRGSPDGVDPISGLRLDRPHRALQLELGLRRRLVGSAHLLWRRMRRGHPGDDPSRERLQFEAGLPRSDGRWSVMARLDRELVDGEAARPRFRLRWEDPSSRPIRRTLTAAWRHQGAGASHLVGFGLEGAGHGLRWAARLAGAGGESSSPWIFGLPGAGVLSPWLRPGGVGLAAGIERIGGSMRLGAHAGVVLHPGQRCQPWLGLRMVGESYP